MTNHVAVTRAYQSCASLHSDLANAVRAQRGILTGEVSAP